MKSEDAMLLLQLIQRDLKNGELTLPTLPNVAINIRKVLAEDGGASATKITEIIASDMATASQLIQVANSPLYLTGNPVNSLKAAVQRLGNKITSQLVNSFVIKQLYATGSDFQQKYLIRIYEDSTNIAAMCRAFAMFAPHLDPEEAMLAGLTHQIGKLPILKYYDLLSPDAYDKAVLDYVLEQVHPTLGQHLLRTWNFPAELLDVPLLYRAFERNHSHQADYIDLVQIAFLQYVAGSNHPDATRDWSTIAAFAKLGFEPDFQPTEQPDLAQQIEHIRSILNNV